jgi:hypothetical protein
MKKRLNKICYFNLPVNNGTPSRSAIMIDCKPGVLNKFIVNCQWLSNFILMFVYRFVKNFILTVGEFSEKKFEDLHSNSHQKNYYHHQWSSSWNIHE